MNDAAPGHPRERERDPRRLALAALAALVAIVGLAAVLDLGPFDDGDQLSREEFIAQGDEICARAHEEYLDLQRRPPETAAAAAVLTDRLIEISERELEDIEALNGPDELDEPLGRYLAAREEGIDLLERGFDAAQDKDAIAYAEAQAEVADSQDERLRLAREVGFSECSRPIAAITAGG